MKVKVKAKNKYKSYELIEHLILLNKEDLASVNQKIRINNPSLYVTAFRLAREKNSIDCYINALIFYIQILTLANRIIKKHIWKSFSIIIWN